jgi:hypothetical protein
MAQMAHRQASVAAPRFGPRHLIWLAALAAIAVAAVLPVALISGSNDSSLDKAAPATQTLNRADGTRYDGGPEEGTAALTQRSARATFHPNSITRPPGVRYDGGPEEGTRDIVPAQPPSTRYDGGPEDGSRGTSH